MEAGEYYQLTVVLVVGEEGRAHDHEEQERHAAEVVQVFRQVESTNRRVRLHHQEPEHYLVNQQHEKDEEHTVDLERQELERSVDISP